MLGLRKVAVTGSIGSGKSTVCSFLKELGAYVLSADEIVHQLLTPQTLLGKKVITLLGDTVVVDSQLSRKAIAEKVFNNPLLLQKLEELIHPEVQRVIEEHQEIAKKARFTLFVVEIPLLFESNLHVFYDTIVLVSAKESLRKQRTKEMSDRKKRESRLISSAYKRAHSHFCIENNNSLEDLKKNIKTLYQQLI